MVTRDTAILDPLEASGQTYANDSGIDSVCYYAITLVLIDFFA